MSTIPTLEEQIAMTGLSYGRRQDISYRTGLVIQVLGAALLAVLYPLANPFYTVGIMLFDAGVLLSAVYLLVWMRSFKIFIIGSAFIGLSLQVAGSLDFIPEQHAGALMIIGVGFVCVAAGGIVGKEAYCFGYREGWLLMMLGFPLMVLTNLLGKEHRIFNSLGFSVLFLLLLSLVGKKLQQQLLLSCTTDSCGQPPAKTKQ